jgi:hypothetical protein
LLQNRKDAESGKSPRTWKERALLLRSREIKKKRGEQSISIGGNSMNMGRWSRTRIRTRQI